MRRLKEVIVVEGRYDKNTLSQVVDAVIITVNGFSVFKDGEKLALLRRLAKEKGLLILTDSDAAGFKIRGHIKGAIKEGKVYHAYIPQILGKESRKRVPSKEGTLGVEGMERSVLEESLRKSGVLFADGPKPDPITRMDFYEAGLSGRENSAALRQLLLKELELPSYLSSAALLEAVNALMSREAFFDLLHRR